jgi:hypothetical protein
MKPNGATISPAMTPAQIIQNEISAQRGLPLTRWTTSKMTAVASTPSGKTMRAW